MEGSIMQYIVISGNPVDGFRYVGPYPDHGEAAVAGDKDWSDTEWWVAPLIPVEDESVWHINVYEVDRAYGGPEEGGWWFDTGRFMPKMSPTLDTSSVSREEAHEHARALDERLRQEADANRVPPVGYTAYRGGRYVVYVEDHPGADWPAERPVYS